ncbi:MAG TPA: hypothetical protein VN328_06775, partial [Thermodesulfovibrionales bacterium]|nr:hypothetical protein [Thermodesulfovibrionales bacterium]
REPLVIWIDSGKRILLGGHNRFAICREHGIDFTVIQARNVTNRHEAKMWILHDQLGKRNLNDFDRARIALQYEDLIKKDARQKQFSGLKQFSSPVSENSPKRAIDTREVTAELAGVSSNTISKVKMINRDASKEQIDRLEKGKASINAIHCELRQEKSKDTSQGIEQLIKKFEWSVNRGTIPIGKRLLDHRDKLLPDQRVFIRRTVLDLQNFSNMMWEMFREEDV